MYEKSRPTTAVIIPTCDDSNRGDQALVWETKRVAEEAGYRGDFYMLSDPSSTADQSEAEGIQRLAPILRHPRHAYQGSSNLKYGPFLILIWGAVASAGFFRSVMLLSPWGRKFYARYLTPDNSRTLRVLQHSDVVLVKGGGFVHSTRSITDLYRGYFFLYHLFLAASLHKRIYVMPNSFGPLEGYLFKKLVKAALRRCRIVTVRESISQQALASIGIRSDVYPDLAFGLTSQETEDSPLSDVRRTAGSRPIVGVTARPYRFPGSKDPSQALEGYLQAMALFCHHVYTQGYYPVLIEHVSAESDHENDAIAIGRIEELLSVGEYASIRNPKLNCRQLKTIYGDCDYVVGTRFHSVIFALSEATPALAIAYGGNKGVGIMRDLGFADFVIEIERFTAEDASRRFNALVQRGELRARLQEVRDHVGSRHALLAAAIRADSE